MPSCSSRPFRTRRNSCLAADVISHAIHSMSSFSVSSCLSFSFIVPFHIVTLIPHVYCLVSYLSVYFDHHTCDFTLLIIAPWAFRTSTGTLSFNFSLLCLQLVCKISCTELQGRIRIPLTFLLENSVRTRSESTSRFLPLRLLHRFPTSGVSNSVKRVWSKNFS